MKLKYRGIVEIEPSVTPGFFRVTKGTELVNLDQVMSLEYIRENFTAADCDSRDLLEPDRTERLCPPIIG